MSVHDCKFIYILIAVLTLMGCSDGALSGGEGQQLLPSAEPDPAPPKSQSEEQQEGAAEEDDPELVDDTIAMPVDINGTHLISGLILSDGLPVEEAQVYVLGHPDTVVFTNELGEYTIPLPPFDSHLSQVSLVAESQSSQRHLGQKQDYLLSDLQDPNANFVVSLQNSGDISGTLHLPDVSDYTGYTVRLVGTDKTAMTDRKGNYTITDVPPGSWPQVQATHPSLKTITIVNVEVKPNIATTLSDGMLLDTFVTTNLSACGVAESGRVLCWGNSFTNGSTGTQQPDSAAAAAVKNIDGLTPQTTAVGLQAGACHVCAVMANGSLKCWGCAQNGRIGNGRIQDFEYEARNVQGIDGTASDRRVKQLALGEHHSCALMEDTSVKCWGRSTFGMLGNGNNGGLNDASSVPVDTLFLDGSTRERSVKYIAAGRYHTCAITLPGEVFCWGGGQDFWPHLQGLEAFGELGNARIPNPMAPPRYNLAPTKVEFFRASTGNDRAKSLHLGEFQSCAIVENGAKYCWGRNSLQIGITSADNIWLPTQSPIFDGSLPSRTLLQLSSSLSFSNASISRNHSCGLTLTNEVWCWGNNNSSELGTDNSLDSGVPVRATVIAPELNVVTVKVGNDPGGGFGCILLDTGKVRCWGANTTKQLGIDSIAAGSLSLLEIDGNHTFALPTYYVNAASN